MNKNNNNKSGVMLYAKTPGITSFSSLWNIKHALGTDKVGHTGTLDSFAEGLLVVLSGSLTHLVPHITAFTKTYVAAVCFGKETDTLDPSGETVKTSKAPSRKEVEAVLPSFTGALLQVPPVYSALHVNGQRASDMIRDGKKVELEPRQVFIYENKLLDFQEASETNPCSYAILEITCSKGTYIRALARDIAEKLGSCAHLSALRRTQVGPFKLEDSACYSELKPFTIENALANEAFFQNQRNKIIEENKKKEAEAAVNKKAKRQPKKREYTEKDEKIFADIRSHFLTFTPDLAFICGFNASFLKKDSEKSYLNGRVLQGKMFNRIECPQEYADLPFKNAEEIAVFYEDKTFAGMININEEHKLNYGFVVPPVKSAVKMKTFSWQQLLNGEFPVEWKKKGTALTVGSFDGMHKGHVALIDSVLDQKNLVHGVVTFKNTVKAGIQNFSGSIDSLFQRMEFCQQKKLDFVLIIDFSDDFSKIEGSSFIQTLVELCNLKFISEGTDFKCGYKGAFGIPEIKKSAEQFDFTFKLIDDVLFEGEKISSSRIRNSILDGDFSSVQKMLLRPYAYDAFGLNFTELKTGSTGGSEMSWFEAEKTSIQILPSDGTYNVVVIMSGQTDKTASAIVESVGLNNSLNTLHTMCCIEKETIKLLLPSQNTASRVRTINFIPAN